MKLEKTPLNGLMLIRPNRVSDLRGYFVRTYCWQTFRDWDVPFEPVQCSDSFNMQRHTLRGLHFQTAPNEESKLVRCSGGAVFDVAVDLREQSPRFGSWYGVVLSAENGLSLFIPRGFAHGFQTLEDRSTVQYFIDTPYQPGHSAGIRWDDPDIAINWPDAESRIISDRDRSLPYLHDFKVP